MRTLIFILLFINISQNLSANWRDTNHHSCDSLTFFDSTYLTNCLNDSNISAFSKQLYFNPKLAGDNYPTFLIFEELEKSRDYSKLPFYFFCITKTIPFRDGAYSEGLGYFAYEFFKYRTSVFLEFFICSDYLKNNEIKLWAETISGEIIIQTNDNKESINKEIKELRNHILTISSGFEQSKKETALKFLKEVETILNNR